MSRRRSFSGFCFVLVLLASWRSHAQVPTVPPGPTRPVSIVETGSHATPGSQVAFAAVDSATVRVMVYQHVGTRRVDTRAGRLPYAYVEGGHGTGFVVAPSGLIVTAYHVIEDADAIFVVPPGDGATGRPARVVATRRDDDLALLSVDGTQVGVELATASLSVRQTVFALGYPIDGSRTTPQSSRGIVSGQLDDGRLQLDMSLNPGNSGGPVIDENNRVVGVVSMGGDVRRGVQGIGIAIPTRAIQALLATPRDQSAPSLANRQLGEDLSRVTSAMDRSGIARILDTFDDEGTERIDVDGDALIANLTGLSTPLGRTIAAAMLWNVGLLMTVDGDHGVDFWSLPNARQAEVMRLLNAASTLADRVLAADSAMGRTHAFLRVAAERSTQRTFSMSRDLAEASAASTRPVNADRVASRFEAHLIGVFALAKEMADRAPSSWWVGGRADLGVVGWVNGDDIARFGLSASLLVPLGFNSGNGLDNCMLTECHATYRGIGGSLGIVARFGYHVRLHASAVFMRHRLGGNYDFSTSTEHDSAFEDSGLVGGSFAFRYHGYPHGQIHGIGGFGLTVMQGNVLSLEFLQVGMGF